MEHIVLLPAQKAIPLLPVVCTYECGGVSRSNLTSPHFICRTPLHVYPDHREREGGDRRGRTEMKEGEGG